MYSKVSICKTCHRRILDEQANLVPDKENQCIYCILDFLRKEIVHLTREKEDLAFSLTLLDRRYHEVNTAYEAAIADNLLKHKEIADIRKDLLTYLNVFGVKPNEHLG